MKPHFYLAVRPEPVEGGSVRWLISPLPCRERARERVETPPFNTNIKINTAGGSPAASHLLLLRQKKVTEEKATPVCRPCGVPSLNRKQAGLRNSRYALRQSSPKPPLPCS